MRTLAEISHDVDAAVQRIETAHPDSGEQLDLAHDGIEVDILDQSVVTCRVPLVCEVEVSCCALVCGLCGVQREHTISAAPSAAFQRDMEMRWSNKVLIITFEVAVWLAVALCLH